MQWLQCFGAPLLFVDNRNDFGLLPRRDGVRLSASESARFHSQPYRSSIMRSPYMCRNSYALWPYLARHISALLAAGWWLHTESSNSILKTQGGRKLVQGLNPRFLVSLYTRDLRGYIRLLRSSEAKASPLLLFVLQFGNSSHLVMGSSLSDWSHVSRMSLSEFFAFVWMGFIV